MLKQLPIYEMTINEDLNSDVDVNLISLVDNAAMKLDFFKFAENEKQINFKIDNEEQRIISGAILVPERLVYRKDEDGTEYYLKINADTIKKMAIKYAAKGNQNKVNLMHNDNNMVQGVTMFESFISDKERGIEPMKGFEDTPYGTWFGSFYVGDDATWNLIKEDKIRGFSIQGSSYLKEVKYSLEDALKEIENIVIQ